MSFQTIYRTLFSVDLLHNYFLSDGVGNEVEESLLLQYDITEFIEVIPTRETKKALDGHKMVFKQAKHGLRVYVKVEGVDPGDPLKERTPFVSIGPDFRLEFILKVNTPYFYNFTDLSLGNPLFFSNASLQGEPVLERIHTSSTAVLIDDSVNYRLSDRTISQMGARIPEFSMGVFGIISLQMRGDTNIITASGLMLASTQRYIIHFKNRETIWQYKNSTDDTMVLTTGPHQLTKFGYREILNAGERLPNPHASTPINASNISEIFI